MTAPCVVIRQVRLEFDFQAVSSRRPMGLPERVSRLFHEGLQAVLAAELARARAGYLPRLVLDLPSVTADQLEQELPRLLRAALQRALLDWNSAASREPARAGTPGEALRHFLRYGSLPWQAAAASFEPDAALRLVLEQQPGTIRALLRPAGRPAALCQRLARQLSESTLKQLLHFLAPATEALVRAYVDCVVSVRRYRPLADSEAALRSVLWELILEDIGANPLPAAAYPAFVERQLRQLATRCHWSYNALLEAVKRSLADVAPPVHREVVRVIRQLTRSPGFLVNWLTDDPTTDGKQQYDACWQALASTGHPLIAEPGMSAGLVAPMVPPGRSGAETGTTPFHSTAPEPPLSPLTLLRHLWPNQPAPVHEALGQASRLLLPSSQESADEKPVASAPSAERAAIHERHSASTMETSTVVQRALTARTTTPALLVYFLRYNSLPTGAAWVTRAVIVNTLRAGVRQPALLRQIAQAAGAAVTAAAVVRYLPGSWWSLLLRGLAPASQAPALLRLLAQQPASRQYSRWRRPFNPWSAAALAVNRAGWQHALHYLLQTPASEVATQHLQYWLTGQAATSGSRQPFASSQPTAAQSASVSYEALVQRPATFPSKGAASALVQWPAWEKTAFPTTPDEQLSRLDGQAATSELPLGTPPAGLLAPGTFTGGQESLFAYLLTGPEPATPSRHATREVLHREAATLLAQDPTALLFFVQQRAATSPVLRNLAALLDFATLGRLIGARHRRGARSQRGVHPRDRLTDALLARLLDGPDNGPGWARRQLLRETYLWFHLAARERADATRPIDVGKIVVAYSLPLRAMLSSLDRQARHVPLLAGVAFFAWFRQAIANITGPAAFPPSRWQRTGPPRLPGQSHTLLSGYVPPRSPIAPAGRPPLSAEAGAALLSSGPGGAQSKTGEELRAVLAGSQGGKNSPLEQPAATRPGSLPRTAAAGNSRLGRGLVNSGLTLGWHELARQWPGVAASGRPAGTGLLRLPRPALVAAATYRFAAPITGSAAYEAVAAYLAGRLGPTTSVATWQFLLRRLLAYQPAALRQLLRDLASTAVDLAWVRLATIADSNLLQALTARRGQAAIHSRRRPAASGSSVGPTVSTGEQAGGLAARPDRQTASLSPLPVPTILAPPALLPEPTKLVNRASALVASAVGLTDPVGNPSTPRASLSKPVGPVGEASDTPSGVPLSLDAWARAARLSPRLLLFVKVALLAAHHWPAGSDPIAETQRLAAAHHLPWRSLLVRLLQQPLPMVNNPFIAWLTSLVKAGIHAANGAASPRLSATNSFQHAAPLPAPTLSRLAAGDQPPFPSAPRPSWALPQTLPPGSPLVWLRVIGLPACPGRFPAVAGPPGRATGRTLATAPWTGRHGAATEWPGPAPGATTATNLLLYYAQHGQAPWWRPVPLALPTLANALQEIAPQQGKLLRHFVAQHAHDPAVLSRVASLAGFSLLHKLLPVTRLGRRRRQVLWPALVALDHIAASLAARVGPPPVSTPGPTPPDTMLFGATSPETSRLTPPPLGTVPPRSAVSPTQSSGPDDSLQGVPASLPGDILPGQAASTLLPLTARTLLLLRTTWFAHSATGMTTSTALLRLLRQQAAASSLRWPAVIRQVRYLLRRYPGLAADPFFEALVQPALLQPRARWVRRPSGQASASTLASVAWATQTAAAAVRLPLADEQAEVHWHVLAYYLQTGLASTADLPATLTYLMHPAHAGWLRQLRGYLGAATVRARLLALLPADRFATLLGLVFPGASPQLEPIGRDWLTLLAQQLVEGPPEGVREAVLAVAAAPGPASAQARRLVQRLLRATAAPSQQARTVQHLLAAISRQPAPLRSALAALLATQLPALPPRAVPVPVPPAHSLPAAGAASTSPAGPGRFSRPLAPGGRPGPAVTLSSEPTYIPHAGLVLLWPFLTPLFSRLGYLTERQFTTSTHAERALHLLHFLATGTEHPAEHLLVSGKLLCGLPQQHPPPRQLPLTADERTLGEDLLRAVISQWSALKNTSVAGLRLTFMQRAGKLEYLSDRVSLTMETQTVDVLLDHLPWSLSFVKLPWLALPLYVTWR